MSNPDLATVPFLLGYSGKKRINVLAFYRQWAVQECLLSEAFLQSSREVPRQVERFNQIVQTWKTLIDENRETISLSDTNLSSPLLLEDGNADIQDLKY